MRTDYRFCAGAATLAVGLLMIQLAGCGNGGPAAVETAEQRVALAAKAGEAAGLAYLAVDKPDKEKAAAVKVVVDKVQENLSAYSEGGFIKALPGIQEAIDKVLPDTEDNKARRLAATKLAQTLLEELDHLFEKHPEWKDKGEEVSAIVAAFCGGASTSFDAYLK